MPNGVARAIAVALAAMAPGVAAADDLDRFTIGTGLFDALEQDEEAAVAGVEWRPGVRYLDVIAPFAGALVTTDGSAYGYAGFGLDFTVAGRFVIMPFTGVGFYAEGGGQDLGHPIQFRSGLELGYRLGSGVQIGVSGFHLSSGGLDEDEDGTEMLMLQLSVPTAGWFAE